MKNEFTPNNNEPGDNNDNIEITIEPDDNSNSNNSNSKKKQKNTPEKTEKKEEDFTNTCPTCNEKYNKQKNKKNLCYCGMEICRKCMKSYILSKEENPKCFQCNTGWTRSFLAEKLENKFITGDYKKHRENNIFNYERTLLPDTQIEVEKIIEDEKIRKAEAKLDDKIQEIMTEKKKLRKEYYEKYYPQLHSKNNATKERRIFIRKCPNGDCMGFLSSSHKCGLCQIWACSECREIKGIDKDAPHQCNPQILESVKLLEKDSKPCPKCASMIFKIEGCDQMWCTNCQTSFSWIHGTILNGHIHNPHYFEWLRLNGTGNGAIERAGEQEQNCQNRILTNRIINRFLTSIKEKHPDLHKDMSNIMRQLLHIQHVEMMDRFQPQGRNDNLVVRIQYMRKIINEEKFKSIIQKKEKRNDKNIHIMNLLQMFISLETDIIYRLFDDLTKSNIDKCREEMEKLREYTNAQFQIISRNFQCVCYEITKDWKFSSNYRNVAPVATTTTSPRN
jgi:hypothetical protein